MRESFTIFRISGGYVGVCVYEILIDWVIDWSREWVILNEWLSGEWVNKKWVKWMNRSLKKKQRNCLFSYIFGYQKKHPNMVFLQLDD